MTVPTEAPPQKKLIELDDLSITHLWVHLDNLTPETDLHAKPSADLHASLASVGMIYPIGVQAPQEYDANSFSDAYHSTSVFRILDGARRVSAARSIRKQIDGERAKELRLDPVFCVVVPHGFSHGHALTLLTNYMRGPNPVRDFLALEQMLKTPGMTKEQIAHDLHLPLKDLHALIRMLTLTPKLRTEFLEGHMKAGIAARVARWPKDRQKQVEDLFITKGSVTGPDLHELTSKAAIQAVQALPFDEVFDTPTFAESELLPETEASLAAYSEAKMILADVAADMRTSIEGGFGKADYQKVIPVWVKRLEALLMSTPTRPFMIVDVSHSTNEDLRFILDGGLSDEKWVGLCSVSYGEASEAVACARAKAHLEDHEGAQSILLLNPDAPSDPKTTKLYRKKWLGGAYAYRVPCGNWKHCQNPEGPIAAYYSQPSKHPHREGPAICRYCRSERGPSQLNRDLTAARNRKGRGIARKAPSP